jgi:5-methylcytosine-specific restriction endonuclease McrA
MGLPRHLELEFQKYHNELMEDSKVLLEQVAFACAEAGASFFEICFEEKKRKPTVSHVINCLVLWRFKFIFLTRHRSKDGDLLAKVDAKLYLGIEERGNGSISADFRDVKVCRLFVPKLSQINKDREFSDRKQLDLLKKIRLVQHKVYASRVFPPSLRVIIFERDGYACKCCGRSRETLFSLRLALQVDHIVAWEDNGKTAYANGQTLCDECNIAKHHTKSYLHGKHMLRHVVDVA